MMRRDLPDTSTIEGRALIELRIAYGSYLQEGPDSNYGRIKRYQAESLAYVISGRSGFDWSSS